MSGSVRRGGMPELQESMRYRSGGTSDNQCGTKQNRTDCHLVEQTGECVETAFTQSGSVLADGGKRRNRVSSHGQIVESYDADIIGNPQTSVPAFCYGGYGTDIMREEDGSYPFFRDMAHPVS